MCSIENSYENTHGDAIWSVDWFKPSEGSKISPKIVTGSLDETVKIWSYNEVDSELKCEGTLVGHNLGVLSVAIAPSGEVFASSSLDCNINIWDFDKYKKRRNIEFGPLESYSVQFTRDSRHILTGNCHGKLDMFNVQTGKKVKTLDPKHMPMSIATSPDGRWIACGCTNGLLSVFDGEGTHCKTLEVHALPVRSISFSPDSRLLITASDDKHMKIYNISDYQVIGTIAGHTSWVLDVSFSPNGRLIASCSSDKSVRIWDLETQTCLNVFRNAHNAKVWALAWGSDTKLCSVGGDGTLNIYKVVE